MAAFKYGKRSKVQQVLPAPVVGEVVDFALDTESGSVIAKVEWKGADGSVHSRFFHEHELEPVSEPVPVKEVAPKVK